MKKKIFWLILVAFLFVGARPASALISEGSSYVEDIAGPNWNLPSHTLANLISIGRGLAALIGGTGDKEADQKLGPSALSATSNLVGYLYAQPVASSIDYFADVGRRLKIAPPAYAQTGGIGFEGLKPILPIWKVFRNIAYVFFTIIFVGMGFAIMFRVKLNPQTVITVQNAIPKVVIALILVTFSYAIAGLLIDLTYVLLSIGVLALKPLAGIQADKLDTWAANGFGLPQGLGFIIGGAAQTAVNAPSYLIGSLVAGALVGWLMSALGATAALAAGGTAVLFLVVFLAICLWAIIKLFISLVRSYISIIIAIIFAPLQIMLGVLPGGQMGFGPWFRNLFANLMVFPAVAIFMILGWVLTAGERGPNWAPPVLGLRGTPLIPLIGFGMLLMVHKIPDIVREALQVKPFPYGAAIGEALAPLRMGARYGGVGAVEAGWEKLQARGFFSGGGIRQDVGAAIKTALQKALGG